MQAQAALQAEGALGAMGAGGSFEYVAKVIGDDPDLEEEERTKKDQLFAGAGEQLKEKKAHEELLKGAERMTRDKQRHSLEIMSL